MQGCQTDRRMDGRTDSTEAFHLEPTEMNILYIHWKCIIFFGDVVYSAKYGAVKKHQRLTLFMGADR